MLQFFEALRMFQAMAAINVPDFLTKPLQEEFLVDDDGRPVFYLNYTDATGQDDGDVAIFVRAISPLSSDVQKNYVSRTLPDATATGPGPAPLLEVWVQDDTSMLSARSALKDQIIFFLRAKAFYNVILKVVDAAHPELDGIFGASADSTPLGSDSRAMAPGMIGGN